MSYGEYRKIDEFFHSNEEAIKSHYDIITVLEQGSGRGWLKHPEIIREQLSNIVKKYPSLREHRVLRFGSRQSMFTPDSLVNGMLEKSAKEGCKTFDSWIEKVLTLVSADFSLNCELVGATQMVGHTLANGVQFCSGAELQDSPHLRRLVKARGAGAFSGQGPSREGLYFCKLDIKNVETTTKENQFAFKCQENIIYESIKSLAIAEEISVSPGSMWLEFVDPDFMMAEASIFSHQSYETTVGSPFDNRIDETAFEWADKYLKLDEKVKRALNVPLSRLAMARRRVSSRDKAVDAAICLESLFGETGGEITFKLKMRSALFLGKSLDEKKSISQKIGNLYSLRSKTVHGSDDKNDKFWENKSIADDAIKIATQIIQDIVNENRLPNKDQLELSEGIRWQGQV